MTRLAAGLLLAAVLAFPASAADAVLAFLPAIGAGRVPYRVVHTVQTASGPSTTTTAFTLDRRSEKTLVLERTGPGGVPDDSVLNVGPDGSLALAGDPRAVAADADLGDVVFGLNLALAAARTGDPTARNPWTVALATARTPNAPPATVMVVPTPVTGGQFDFNGDGSTALTGAQSSPSPDEVPTPVGAGGGGFPGGGGGRGGGGFGGGGFPGGAGSGFRQRSPRPATRPANGPPVAVRVQGQVTNGRLTRIAITETRSLTVADMTYTNVGSWAITVGR